MALGFYITGNGFTQERYDSTLAQLEEAGAGAPDGRISHVALETGGEIQVFGLVHSAAAPLENRENVRRVPDTHFIAARFRHGERRGRVVGRVGGP